MNTCIYVNMDENLIPKDKRCFSKISPKELVSKLKEVFLSIPDNRDDWESSDDEDKQRYEDDCYAYGIMHETRIEQDLEYIDFDDENFTALPEWDIEHNGNLMGLHTLDNGLSFVGCMAGGDWEIPVFFIYFYDGQNIRAYIPRYGNTVNLDAKTAFGSEGERLEDEDMDKLYSKEILDQAEDDPTVAYFLKQGINYQSNGERITPNWKAIKEELLTVFE